MALSLRAESLEPADRVHAGTCQAHAIDTIVTADAGSAGLRGLRRVDPLDASALRHVLG